MTRVVTLSHGRPGYAALLTQLRRDPALVAAMWADAESRPDELDVPGTRWTVALAGGGLAAWCAASPAGGVLRCHSNFEVPAYRGRGLYGRAYRERHRAVVLPCGLLAVTYLFAQPIGLHEADGWVRTGVSGVSFAAGEPHAWWELRRVRPSG